NSAPPPPSPLLPPAANEGDTCCRRPAAAALGGNRRARHASPRSRRRRRRRRSLPAMAKYEYDESGATFYYFLLSLVFMLVLPPTIGLLSGAADKERTAKSACSCAACRNKEKVKFRADRRSFWNRLNKKLTFTVIGWVLIVLLSVLVYKTEAPVIQLWDPFKILGLEHSATVAEIKKAYRTLSRTQHPDKVPEEMKEEANQKWTGIVKAYTALTNEDLRKNFEEFGHPDGRQAMTFGIALPTWIVEGHNSFFVLTVYGVGFGLLLPFLVGRWWYSAKLYSKDRILNRTMGAYFKAITERSTVRDLIAIIASAREFRDDLPSGSLPDADDLGESQANGGKSQKASAAATGHKELDAIAAKVCAELDRRSEKVEKRKKGSALFAHRATTLLLAHMLRIPVEDPRLAKDQAFIVEKSIHLLNGMLQITVARFWLAQSLNCMSLSQMLVQALWISDPPIVQLPHITSTSDVVKHARTKKRDVRTIDQLMSLPQEERDSLLRSLTEEQKNEVVRVAGLYPVLEGVKAEFKVTGDKAITPGAIVIFVCRLRLRRPGEKPSDEKLEENGESHHDDDDETEEFESPQARRRRLAEESQKPRPVHAPYLLGMEKRPYWWISLGDISRGRLVVPPAKFGGLETVRTVSFSSP
ncbi:MAG: Sec63 Brl domain-containing protein, partial [Olpidium bornovanus]